MAFSDNRRYYQILELELGASAEEVNQAYKDLAFIWHPDRIPDDNPRLKTKAQEKLKQLNEARSFFRDYFRHRPSTAAKVDRTTGPTQQPRSHHVYTAQHAATPHGERSPAETAHSYRSSQHHSTTGQPHADRPADRTASHGVHADSDPFAWRTPPRRSPFGTHSNQAHNNHAHTAAATDPHPQSPPPHNPRPSAAASPPPPEAPPRRPRPPIVPPQWMEDRPPPRPLSDLSGSKLRGANLRERDFAGRNLSGADLVGADLTDAFMHRVNLSGADLSGARLFRANLLQADLSGANLSEANLIGADLSGADLRNANLTNAKMSVGGRLMVRLTGAKLEGAIIPGELKRSP